MRISSLGRLRRRARQAGGVSQAGLAAWWIHFRRGNDQVGSSTAAAAAAGLDPQWPGGINADEDVDQESRQPSMGAGVSLSTASRTFHLRRCLVPAAVIALGSSAGVCYFVCVCLQVCVCPSFPNSLNPPTSTSRAYLPESEINKLKSLFSWMLSPRLRVSAKSLKKMLKLQHDLVINIISVGFGFACCFQTSWTLVNIWFWNKSLNEWSTIWIKNWTWRPLAALSSRKWQCTSALPKKWGLTVIKKMLIETSIS